VGSTTVKEWAHLVDVLILRVQLLEQRVYRGLRAGLHRVYYREVSMRLGWVPASS
jgi:hypothetical protein